MSAEYRQLILGEEFADLLEEPVPAAEPAVDVEALCDTLIENLEAQHGLYVEYLEQANRQRLALVNRRLSENQEVNLETDKLLNSLARLEESRVAVTARILGPRLVGAASTPAKCEAIYPLVSPEKAALLKVRRDALVAVVADLKRVMAVNTALVENGSKIIHTTIGILTSVVGRTKSEKMNTYTSKGNVHVGRLQLRNLVNRSV